PAASSKRSSPSRAGHGRPGRPLRCRHDADVGGTNVAEYRLDRNTVHFKWNNALAPGIAVEPVDVVHCWTQEGTHAQVSPGFAASVLSMRAAVSISRPAVPIRVGGVGRGVVFVVDIMEVRRVSWGWSGVLPGLGVLSDASPGPYNRHWAISNHRTAALGG